MRTLASAVTTALAAGTLAPRDFLRLVARDRSTGDPVAADYWSGAGSLTADVIDPASGATVSRTCQGLGQIVAISPVPMVVGLTVQAVEIVARSFTVEPETSVEEMLRTYDLRRGRVELHRGFLDPNTGLLVAPAVPRFTGIVDEAQVETPETGGEGAIRLTCVSHAQELTRTNSAKRSGSDQRQRAAGDAFYDDTAVVGTWKVFWGEKAS